MPAGSDGLLAVRDLGGGVLIEPLPFDADDLHAEIVNGAEP